MTRIVSRDQLYEGCKVQWASLSGIFSDNRIYTVSSIEYTDDPRVIKCVLTWDGSMTKYNMLITNFLLVSKPVFDLDQDDDECV